MARTRRHTLNFSLLLLLVVFLFIIGTTTSYDHDHHHLSYTIRDDVCTKVECGEGKCVPDLGGLLYHCECNPGWKAIQIGPLTFPSCLVPNCTLNFTCGTGAPPPPLFQLPPLNFSSPCNLVWCGDGNCVVNGTGHYCQCYDGSANLFDNPDFVCMEQCSYGADCHHLNLGPQPLPLPPPPPSPTSGSAGRNGPKEASNCWRTLPKLIIAMLTTATFLTWV